jgi:hypothetical protein
MTGLALNCGDNDCSAQMAEKEDKKFVYPENLAHEQFFMSFARLSSPP